MSATVKTLEFFLHDEVDGRPLTAATVDLLTLHQFMGEVIDLIQGEAKRTDLGQPSFAMEDGSVKLISTVTAIVAVSFQSDMRLLEETSDLDAISPKRAQIIETWQSRANKPQSKRRYSITADPASKEHQQIRVNPESTFRHHQLDNWVRTEKYLTGRVVGLGGKTRPNIHLVLPSNQSVKVDATENQLEGADYLYRTITLNVTAMEHLRNGQMRDIRLIDVVRPAKEIDEDKLQALWKKGRNAWAQITSPTEWVESLRES